MILRLGDPETLAARIARLNAPHIAPLEKWREALFSGTRSVPHFDPADGGADARILLLLETPGPSTAAIRFVSRDNPSGTARNLRRFLGEAAISRAETVL